MSIGKAKSKIEKEQIVVVEIKMLKKKLWNWMCPARN
jgi:hypothetical protein